MKPKICLNPFNTTKIAWFCWFENDDLTSGHDLGFKVDCE